MSVELTIIFERGEDGFWVATIPEVPGAFSQGKSKDSARRNVISAMEELMAARRDMAARSQRADAVVEHMALHA